MTFLFIVQAEGRGHMTQAIAFSNMLRKQGHELAGVILGKSKRRTIPEFFSREISAPIHLVDSPNFACDKEEKKILIGKTIRQNLAKASIFWQSLREIHEVVKAEQPDIILNFYDLLGGIYNGIFKPKAQYWVIGHQYLIYHPNFKFAPAKGFNKFFFKFNTRLTALGASEKLALSFYQLESTDKITVVPPLLREDVKKLTPTSGDFFLTYIVNSGYSAEVLSFAKANPHLHMRVYWDKKDAAENEYPLPNLSFHRVHDKNFLRDMAACKGLVSTAGFESICEAMYLGKPVMVIPVAGQYEQACNALDTAYSGAGIASENFDFAKLDKVIQANFITDNSFQDWVSTWPQTFELILPETKMTEPDFILTQSFS
ncbi:glycosyltransferase family protein [Algoriphagus sp. D3-2-R+10]|uniref:glycosyltransferase family protein n=1 Tax=Algoriphagus aurantiacus TaxID=3103948 RepID=UPI002B3D0727|nr:glycosyltransferase family protein [Algoriphagus sp. D3-2-R+10]MEB2775966.1 glycosyltransferase family protein [Algoriphagus sp. D3-2-R+10]